jgi:hypothetical protein
VRVELGLASLQLAQPGSERGRGVGLYTHRQGVDEHPEHHVGPRQVRRAPRDGEAEHHVLHAGVTAEEQAPGGLHDGVRGELIPARLRLDFRRDGL